MHTLLWLVLRWVTISGFNSGAGHLSRYVVSHPGQLCLAIPSCVGTMSTSQRAMMPCGWGVKAGIVHLCDPLVTHGPYLRTLAVVLPIIRRYTNNQITYCSDNYEHLI